MVILVFFDAFVGRSDAIVCRSFGFLAQTMVGSISSEIKLLLVIHGDWRSWMVGWPVELF